MYTSWITRPQRGFCPRHFFFVRLELTRIGWAHTHTHARAAGREENTIIFPIISCANEPRRNFDGEFTTTVVEEHGHTDGRTDRETTGYVAAYKLVMNLSRSISLSLDTSCSAVVCDRRKGSLTLRQTARDLTVTSQCAPHSKEIIHLNASYQSSNLIWVIVMKPQLFCG